MNTSTFVFTARTSVPHPSAGRLGATPLLVETLHLFLRLSRYG
jgi:hypothetical protein